VREEFDRRADLVRSGRAGPDSLVPIADALRTAALAALPADAATRWRHWHLAGLKCQEVDALRRIPAGAALSADALAAMRRRVEAELELLTSARSGAVPANAKAVELARKQVQTLEGLLNLQQKSIDAGSFDINSLVSMIGVYREIVDASRAAFGESTECLEKHRLALDHAWKLQTIVAVRFKAGTVRQTEMLQCEAEVLRLEREYELLRTKVSPNP
jgi:hypothetical protein